MNTRHSLLVTLAWSTFLFPPLEICSQQFTRVTTSPVTTTPSGSRSCNFLDFNHDDFQDFLITNGTTGGEDNMLYLNNGDGTFTLVNDTVCRDHSPSDGATAADYDNDGFIDLYVVNWYGVDNLLYHNAGGASFTQVDTGTIPHDGGYSETAAWGDMDQDGLLDLYVTNSAGTLRNFLYRNLGGGAFEKVTTVTPATEQYASRCVNWIDYDLDGDQDLFVANEATQRNNLYRNDGYPNFTKIMTGPHVTSNFSSHSGSWADYDNDGDLDLLVANYNQVNQLFQNDGMGNFTQVSNPFGTDIGCSFSSSFADYDNDGDLDLFVTNGFCQSYVKNYLYENHGNGTFTRNLTEPMAIDSGSSYGCAWGDYDNDGFMDLLVANWRNETQPNSLYHNGGNAHHWMELKLQGTPSNRSAIGAIVRCKAILNGNPVWQLREVTSQSGYCSQNSLVVHFGLADATLMDSLEVRWPSGTIQTFTGIAPNHLYSLVENGSITVVGRAAPTPEIMDIHVFPSPSKGSFTVELQAGHPTPLQVQVMDQLGRPVFAHSVLVTGKVRLPISLEVPSGVYSVVVVGDAVGTQCRKMVVVN